MVFLVRYEEKKRYERTNYSYDPVPFSKLKNAQCSCSPFHEQMTPMSHVNELFKKKRSGLN